MKIDPKVLQRVQRDLEEELLFGRPVEVLLDENNLVVEPNSYITPQQARDYYFDSLLARALRNDAKRAIRTDLA